MKRNNVMYEFWQNQLATGGTQAKLGVIHQLKAGMFWDLDSWECIGVLDATELIPQGSSKWLVHTTPREGN